jgi:hypothetical protein
MALELEDPRDRPTDPAPTDPEARLGQQLAELELALARVGELVGKVHYTINAIKVSQLTAEHRTHAISEAKRNDRRWLVDLERRVRELESTAAE